MRRRFEIGKKSALLSAENCVFYAIFAPFGRVRSGLPARRLLRPSTIDYQPFLPLVENRADVARKRATAQKKTQLFCCVFQIYAFYRGYCLILA